MKENEDAAFRDFSAKLTPTDYPMTGVRLPVLRKLAADVVKAGYGEAYLAAGERDTYERVMLYGFILAKCKCDEEEYLKRIDAFIPYIDNWAVCDCFVSSLKYVNRFLPRAAEHIFRYENGGPWARRVLAVFMMDYLMREDTIERVLDTYAVMPQGEYYVDMGIAWGLSVALVKFYEPSKNAIAEGRYSRFVTNKAIQKARESFRVSPRQKEELLRYKVK